MAQAKVQGLAARAAALRMLDAVLRRGETLDLAERSFAKGLTPSDRGLARAIAGESLRWLVDLDAMIDSATKQVLPEDAKPRTVLRMMLAQVYRLDTPPHAAIATGLELLSGGPRRLAHGVFSALTKQDAALPDVPTLPAAVTARWGEMLGDVAMEGYWDTSGLLDRVHPEDRAQVEATTRTLLNGEQQRLRH